MRKRHIYLLLSFLLLVSMFISGCKQKTNQLDVDFTLGYDNALKVSAGNPLVASIKNNGQGFTGELQIEVNQTPNESLIFAKEFQIADNGEKDIHMVIPIYTIQRTFKVRILVDGKQVFEDNISSGRFIAPVQPVVAVISDQPDEYRFLNSANYENYYGEQDTMNYYYNNTSYATTTVEEVKDTNEPELFYFNGFENLVDIDNLEFFNYIYIGDNENLKISEKMEEKLLNWVAQGGTLFIESGEDYKRLYSFVPESITNFNVEGIETVSKDMLFEKYGLDSPITIVKGEPIDNTDVMNYEEDDIVLAQFTRIEQGQIINLLVDLTQKALDNWPSKNKLIDEFLRRGINASNSLFNSSYQDNNINYEYYDMLRYIPSEKKPPYAIMAIIFILYVVLAGPILYIILKANDKRDWMWIGVPALSVLCLILLYIFGFGTRYNNPIINSISNIEYIDGNNQMTIDSKIAVFNNRQGNMSVNWDPNEKITIASDPYGYYGSETSAKKIKGKILNGNRTTYEVYDTPLWSKVDLDAKTILPLEVSQEGQFITFDITGDDIRVSVNNKTPFDLESTYVQWGSSYIYIGKLEANEIKEITVSISEMQSDIYAFSEYFYTVIDGSDISEAERKQQRSNMEMYLRLSDEYRGGISQRTVDLNAITLKGVNNSDIGYDFQVNGGDADAFNRNIVTINTDIEFKSGTSLNLPSGFLVPKVKAGMSENDMYDYYIDSRGFEEKSVSFYSENIADFIFEVPEYLEIESIQLEFNPVSNEQDYWNKTEFEDIPVIPNVDYLIYDVQQETFVEYDTEFLGKLNTIDVTKYLDKNNLLRLRIKLDKIDSGYKDNGKAMKVPDLIIEGRAK